MRFEILQGGLLRRQKGLAEGVVRLPVHRAVDVIGIPLVVTGGPEGHREIDALPLDDGAGGIKEVAFVAPCKAPQILRQRL